MLPELQARFLDHLFERGDAVLMHIAAEGAFSPQQRMQVYKNSTQLILTDILQKTFPAVTRLVDEKFMRHAALEFMRQAPPQSGDMNDYGSLFPDFLKAFPPLKEHPYMQGVAALEWAWQESYLSPLHPAAMAPPFRLQPHVRLVSSAWPVVNIWQFALGNGPPPDMATGEYFAMTARRGNTVEVWRLEKPAFMALTNLADIRHVPGFDRANFLTACRNAGIFQAD